METATYRDGFPSDGHSVKETLRPVSRAHTTSTTEADMTSTTDIETCNICGGEIVADGEVAAICENGHDGMPVDFDPETDEPTYDASNDPLA